jgi:hypothetical protein
MQKLAKVVANASVITKAGMALPSSMISPLMIHNDFAHSRLRRYLLVKRRRCACLASGWQLKRQSGGQPRNNVLSDFMIELSANMRKPLCQYGIGAQPVGET